MRYVIVTGLSGAGRSQAMKAFEDMGWYCVDNMPPLLIPTFAELVSNQAEPIDKAALVTDIRGGRFFDDLEKGIDGLIQSGADVKILFLEASNTELIKRFKESRRTHPMNPVGRIEVGIDMERTRLETIRDRANKIIDTSKMTIGQLRTEISKAFESMDAEDQLTISIQTFGYKRGVPLDADLVFDVRMLPNPFYVPELKALTGNDLEVQNYVMKFQDSLSYFEKLLDLVEFLIPLCVKEKRAQLVIAIGCTGGQHRSVTFGNLMAKILTERGKSVMVYHRELNGK
ncbi:MAG: RNase adapter RapZ [Erysipelotrichaceae bacterium]|nr:RNase adapter RapZ [Erysipelotrichaceae bacterium]